MSRLSDCIGKEVFGISLLFFQIFIWSYPQLARAQCGDNLIINGSFDGPVGWSTNADGWTSDGTDPDLNTTEELFGNVDWSQDPILSDDGGTWQNISTIGEKLQQVVNLVPGRRYLLEFEFTSHGLVRNEDEVLFQEQTGVLVTVGDQILKSSIDTTPYTWESTCLSFIAKEEVTLLTFEGSVSLGYLGLDGVCLSMAEDQIKIDDTSFCLGDELSFEIESSSFTEVIWNDTLSATEIDVIRPGKYWVDLTDKCGTYRENFEVLANDCGCQLYIPNTFSLNTFGIDDSFSVGTNCELEEYELLIHDRWGNQIFASSDLRFSWDGRIGSEDAIAGVYFYKLTYSFLDNEKVSFGTLNVLR